MRQVTPRQLRELAKNEALVNQNSEIMISNYYSLYLPSITASSKKYTNSNRQRNTFISLKKKKINLNILDLLCLADFTLTRYALHLFDIGFEEIQ